MWKDGTIACRECDKEVGTYDGEFGPTFIDEEHRKIWYDERSRSLGSVRNRNDENPGEAQADCWRHRTCASSCLWCDCDLEIHIVMDEQTDEEYYEMWERILDDNGLQSLIPVEDYFSRDMTEASIMIEFWKREDVIIPKVLQ